MAEENRRSKLTRKLLRLALLELLKEKSLPQISIREICEKADMNRTTFYLHYHDQYELMDELIDEAYTDTVNYMEEVKVTGSLEYLTAYMSYIKKNGDLFRTLLIDSGDHRLEQKLTALSVQNISAFTPQLPDTVESRYIRTYVVEGSFRTLVEWIRNDFDMPVEKVAKLHWQVSDIIYRSMAGLV